MGMHILSAHFWTHATYPLPIIVRHPPSARLVLLEIGDRRPLKRHYYTDEIVRSIYDPSAHMIVERVIARRRINGKRMAYVKFRDYVGECVCVCVCVHT